MIEDFRALIAAATAVAIYPKTRPQASALPAIVYHVITDDPDYTLKRASGLARGRVQVNCIGARYSDANALASTVRDALSGFHGDQGDTAFRGIFIDNARDLFDPASESDTASRTYGISIDFTFWHRSL